MRRKTIILAGAIAVFGSGGVLAWSRINFYMLTGHFSPIHKIETLHNPVAVSKWSSNGLHLADGRTIHLRGLRSLPSESLALTEATKRGVEIHPDGRIWALVKVHHWCGNDPVREHIARVELSEMMTFLRVGDPVAAVPEAEFLVKEPGGRITEWGWHVGEFRQFQAWESMKGSAR